MFFAQNSLKQIRWMDSPLRLSEFKVDDSRTHFFLRGIQGTLFWQVKAPRGSGRAQAGVCLTVM